MRDTLTSDTGSSRRPPLLEILLPAAWYEPEEPPLHRWDNGLCDETCSTAPRKPMRSELPCPQKPDPCEPCMNPSNPCSKDHPAFLAARAAGPPRLPRRQRSLTRIFDIDSISLVPINLDSGIIKEEIAKPLSEVVSLKKFDFVGEQQQQQQQQQKDVTVVFAIRRPGCGNCREHGLQLTNLLAADPNINLIGTIKETGVNDDDLVSFYEKYFKFPLYKDDNWDLYHALGDRKISVWKILSTWPKLHLRYKEKNIENGSSLGGDGFTQGGVLIFDKQGKLQYVYYEKYSEELDLEAISWAISEVRKSV